MLPQIATVSRIDRQITSKRPAQRFVGGDQGAQPLVDLAIHALPALLNRDHRKQADTDADERNDRQAQQRGDERMQRAEIETAQLDLRKNRVDLRWKGLFLSASSSLRLRLLVHGSIPNHPLP